LLHQPLYLRGLWRDDTLKFDETGKLRGTSLPMAFTLDGIEITKVRLKPDSLQLEGRRIGLTFKGNTPQRVVLKVGNWTTSDEGMHLEIAASPSGDYSAALDAILTTDLAELIPLMPVQWRWFATNVFSSSSPLQPVAHSTGFQKMPGGPGRVVAGVTPPKVLTAPEPQFTAYAKALRYAGNCLVYLQVNPDGKPVNVSILRPIGLGLDEQAIIAVQSYRFTPAMKDGHAVTVEMNVEVNFQIF